jgi:hypothetical protein
MIIIGTFEHSIELEKLLLTMERRQIPREKIMAVPMDIDPDNPFGRLSRKRELLNRGIEIGIACAAFCSLLGACFGFILTWGPVFWGLIFTVFGFFSGFGVFLLIKKTNLKNIPKYLPEITLIIECLEEQAVIIAREMWQYRALSVGTFKDAT